jgi:SPP1 gp7 family putative phage head morphogenesis protein
MSKIPNRQQRLRLAHQQLHLRQIAEHRLQAQLYHEFQRAIRVAAAAFPHWKPTLLEHRNRLRAILRANLRRAGLTMAHHARDQLRQISKQDPGAVERKDLPTGDELDASILSALDDRVEEIYSDLFGTTSTRIANAIRDGLDSNDTPEEIARRIRDEVGGMSMARARSIARTETAVAMNTAQHEEMQNAEQSFGITMQKVWAATEDSRTRPAHEEADGQAVAMDEPFIVDGEPLDYPSDPNGSPENIINCRCVALYVPV